MLDVSSRGISLIITVMRPVSAVSPYNDGLIRYDKFEQVFFENCHLSRTMFYYPMWLTFSWRDKKYYTCSDSFDNHYNLFKMSDYYFTCESWKLSKPVACGRMTPAGPSEGRASSMPPEYPLSCPFSTNSRRPGPDVCTYTSCVATSASPASDNRRPRYEPIEYGANGILSQRCIFN